MQRLAISGPEERLPSISEIVLILLALLFAASRNETDLSRIWTPILESGSRDPVPLELFIERTAGYTEPLSGALDATFFVLEDVLDVLSFYF